MSIFGTILSKLGMGGNSNDAVVAAAPVAVAPAVAVAVAVQPEAKPVVAASAVAISDVDVVAKLQALTSSHSETLNWKVSIVDLLKLLGLESSLQARKDLAVELACPADKMGDSAQMNMWLHKAVLKKLAENGGNIPASMLD
ncbi:MAG: DUF3597 domain-containing protein [Aquabacterium sp.]|nr:DUF3597 domain-containing protein [Aquabacterium sp.]